MASGTSMTKTLKYIPSQDSCFPNNLIYYNLSKRKRKKMKLLSYDQLFVTLWTVAYQVPSSMGFSRQEYWSGLPFPSPGDPPDPGIEPWSLTLQADTLPSEPPGSKTSAK